MHTILIVDDHKIIIDGIKAMLINEENINIVGEAKNGNEAIQFAGNLKPNIIIMDISMPELNGIEATKVIKKEFPKTKILILTQYESKEYVLQAMNSGADGYLLKNSKKEELLDAISVISNGNKYLGKKISNLMIDDMFDKSKHESKDDNPILILTKREIEIIKLLANDFNNQDVADKLIISLRTVETHRRNIMLKLNLKSAVALVRFAIKHNLVNI